VDVERTSESRTFMSGLGQKENWASLSLAQHFIVGPVLVATRGRQTKGK
jgi:hypothetical protein